MFYFTIGMKRDIAKEKIILDYAYGGASLATLRKVIGMESRTFNEYLAKYPDFKAEFESARSCGVDELADTLLDLPEKYGHTNFALARVHSDNIKWYCAKRKPSTYGERVQVDLNAIVDVGAAIAEAKRRVIDVTPREPTGIISDTAGYKPQRLAPQIKQDAPQNTTDDIFS